MLRRYDVHDIAGIIEFDDHLSDFFPCEKGEWIQWLVQNVDDPRYLIIGTDNSYLVAVDTIERPVSDFVSIIFCYSQEGNVADLKDAVSQWGEERGASKVQFVTRDIKTFGRYGVEQYGVLGGWVI